MDARSLLGEDVWQRTPPEAQGVILSLEKRIRALEERLGLNSTNSSKPPSTDPPQSKQAPPRRRSGKKRGGQPGHQRHSRPLVPPDQVRKTIDVKPKECEHCAYPLRGDDPDPWRHQVAELPPMRPDTDEFRLHTLECRRCGHRTRACLPPDVPRGHFGPRLAAVISLLAGAYRLGKRPIQQLVHDLFGLSISLGMICKLEQRTATALEKPVEELLEQARTEPAHVDETGWREQGQRGWLWVMVTATVTVFRIARYRSAAVLHDLLGSAYHQVVTCDRFKAYRGLRYVQWCWAHLRRDFQAMIDRGGSGKLIGEELLELADVMFDAWNNVRDGTLSQWKFQEIIRMLKADVHEQLELGIESDCRKTAATCLDLLMHESWLWTFAHVKGVEPTNNEAERTVRHAVLWRKSSFGTNSARGSRFVERVLSMVATCRQQQRNALEYLTECHRALIRKRPSPSLLPKARAVA